jgi:uncharacterized protein
MGNELICRIFVCISQCAWGPTPTRCGSTRYRSLAAAAGAADSAPGHGQLHPSTAGRSHVLVLTLLLACASCASGPPPYADEIAQWRVEKDQFMRASDESPVPPDKRGSFPPLPYFPVDESYRVPASLKPSRDDVVIEMSTSDGETRKMRTIGTLEFTLKGQQLSLTAFAGLEDTRLERLFVPFGDLTSGAETYQGGRYLDLDRTATNIYDLDFNRAYHPFCVFNPSFICPIPPKENRLKVPVRAGERLEGNS